MDRFKIDSHKLMYHIDRLHHWLKGDNIYPIYIEISPSGACNHRCTYCALDFMEYKPRFLDADLLKERLSEMASSGVKSVMYAGEGEPFLHRDIVEIVRHTRMAGIDVAITTNGVLLKRDFVDSSLEHVTWIKVSINGAKSQTYSAIHRTKPDDFYAVIDNLSYAAALRDKKKYKCVLGMQILLLPENHKEIIRLAKLAKQIGMDYLVIKPYSHHPFSRTTRYKDIRYGRYLKLQDRLRQIDDKHFSVVFRINAMRRWDEAVRGYQRCYALRFWSYIDAGGDVWGCSAYLKDKRFLYGNIYKNTFIDIWQGGRREKALKMAENRLNINNCRVNCRMEAINTYLWELKHPSEHINFI